MVSFVTVLGHIMLVEIHLGPLMEGTQEVSLFPKKTLAGVLVSPRLSFGLGGRWLLNFV